jgi:hypothetical protein
MSPVQLVAALALVAGAACTSGPSKPGTGDYSGLGSDEVLLAIDQRCPGDPACPDSGDGKLYVGAAKRDVTPLVEPFVDLNHDGNWEPGEPFTDLNGNGRFDHVWLAGYGSGRLAFGVHDATWVRCWAARQNQTTVAECSVDCVGLFHDELDQIRADLDPALGVDLVLLGATHVHESQDTIGIWGPDDTSTGYDADYNRRIRRAAVEAITEAVQGMRPAKMAIGSIPVEDPGGDMTPYVWDSRDPVVIDNVLHLLQFDGADDGKPIVTVIDWSSHPEELGGDNRYVTSDFVHYLRESVEAGTGSDVVYVSGSVGGLLTALHTTPIDDDGNRLPTNENTFRSAEAIGHGVARFALKAFAARTAVDNPRLAFRHASVAVHIDNNKFQAAAAIGLIRLRPFGYDPAKPQIRTDEFDNVPQIETSVTYVTLGPAAMMTCPGELLPENFVGGYDGSYAGAYKLYDPTKENAPDLSKAPKRPYLIDMMDAAGPPEHRMILGVTNDFLGYIIPRYDFVVDPVAPYIAEATNHYEETNSLGPRAEPEIVGTMRQLALSTKTAP